MSAISNRYEFVYLFDVENGNSNGDPDAGNLPRVDPETGHGLVTDVCLKRKIRNFVEIAKGEEKGFNIYVAEKAVLNRNNEQAYKALEIKPDKKKLPKDQVKARELTRWMCDNFFDVRTFGAVMTTEVNCGQVRGPVQLTFAKSVEPIMPSEISITRMAVTNEKDVEKERTIGRKFIVPYALYRAEGYISAHLADGDKGTGFSESDLELLWQSLANMFDHDHSAARGKMNARGLVVFKHETKLGNAPAHKLFDTVSVEPNNNTDGPARAFSDYTVKVDESAVPEGVELDVKF
ncbi:type I-C CRISPR-associated protein Cas7/Csd2 [Desulfovibrio sp. JC022]|uniref:type I-C CRISPR-associated protein Cas7/Csd2 n=1 Tax=Desulfovibrio sp. JC022 TaxID=2593642 RepID=UPI0013D52F6E|nr:type I-C CRISPR-associated protein Cas7/Csd2 [Desulfovibrio sp. JC022]NDV24308.1 type I-C CRISPR-associated protein Cas7/Csd2 [Desulfovibrio sp. JC022]